MSSRTARFRQHEVTRAIKAVKAADLDVQQVDIMPDGRIIIRTSDGSPLQPSALDKWMETRARQA